MIFSFQNASFRDGETGLYNQEYFMEVFNREWHRLLRNRTALSILFLNPHIQLASEEEKQYFIDLANILKQQMHRSTDIICRFDTKFFAVGLFDLNQHGTKVIVKRIQEAMNQGSEQQSKTSNITVGAINVLPAESINIENIFQQTALTLKEAENEGRNSYKIHPYRVH